MVELLVYSLLRYVEGVFGTVRRRFNNAWTNKIENHKNLWGGSPNKRPAWL